jgi:hypothetical protein
MRRATFISILVSFAFFVSCASTPPAAVPVLGSSDDLVRLAGEWSGSYHSAGTGRSGSITFSLADNPQGAHGDVLMVPKQDFTYDNSPRPEPRSMTSGASVLAIEFVRVKAQEVTGRIAPYPDPEMPEATLETHFSGRVEGDWIEGTFVTYSDRGVSPRRGTWQAHRKSMK